jgi:hypothetical protein
MRLFQAFQTLLLIFALQQGTSAISAPLAGDTLSGQVAILGTVDAPNFASAELAFAYASDPTGTWFRLQAFSQPVQDAALAEWDTTQVTDGEYSLRLRVYSQEGTFQDFTVTGLLIRNNTTPATPTLTLTPEVTPTAAASAATEPPIVVVTVGDEPQPTATPVLVSPSGPTPVPLPANPAAISVDEINFYLIRGALLALILFIVLGIFLRFRSR